MSEVKPHPLYRGAAAIKNGITPGAKREKPVKSVPAAPAKEPAPAPAVKNAVKKTAVKKAK
jgi:hypothetical protein